MPSLTNTAADGDHAPPPLRKSPFTPTSDEARQTDTVEWQASPNGGRWCRIDPPKGETLQQRIDYLRQFTRGDGTPAYRIRRMVAETPLIAAASALLAACESAEWMLARDYIDPQKREVLDKVDAAIRAAGGVVRYG